MRKTYSMLALTLLWGIAATAQLTRQKKEQQRVPVAKHTSYSNARLQPHHSNHLLNAIWTDDFSNAANWVKTHEAGTSSDWVVGTTGPGGSFPIDPINSASAANGFALFDSDTQCDVADGQVAHLTNANPINCSAVAGVNLTFSEYYSRFWDSTYVYVSSNGTTWTRFEVNRKLFPNDILADNPTIIGINISSVAAHQATVYIRFTFYSPVSLQPGLAGCGYAWMIDDVSLNEIAPTDVGILNPSSAGEYCVIPVSQIQAFHLGSRIVNSGVATATNVGATFDVFWGLLHFSDSSAITSSLSVGDTTTLLTPKTSFAPTDTGFYDIEYGSFLNESDGDSTNNIFNTAVYVNDSIYARDLTSIGGGTFLGGFGLTNSPGYLGQIFHVYAAGQFTSSSFYLSNATRGENVDVSVYSVTSGGLPDQQLGSSAQYTLTSADTGGALITLPFSSPINVTPGDYFVALHQINNTNVSLGASDEIYTPGKVLLKAGNSNWERPDTGSSAQKLTFMLSVNMGPSATAIHSVGNDQSGITVYPNPAKDEIFILAGKQEKNVTVNVLNSVGQSILIKTFDRFLKEKIDLSSQPNGIYTVRISTSSGMVNKNIIVTGK